MTQAQFEEFWNEIIPSALFHTMPTDKDEHGGRYDETTLVQILSENPGLLEHARLSEFVEHFITNADKHFSNNK